MSYYNTKKSKTQYIMKKIWFLSSSFLKKIKKFCEKEVFCKSFAYICEGKGISVHFRRYYERRYPSPRGAISLRQSLLLQEASSFLIQIFHRVAFFFTPPFRYLYRLSYKRKRKSRDKNLFFQLSLKSTWHKRFFVIYF